MKTPNEKMLWNDFIALTAKYKDTLVVPEFSYYMLQFAFKLMFHSAPSKEAVKELTENAMKDAYECYLGEKNNG
jgi:hypothetical protein